jgi:hypothetical protein
MYHLFHKRYYLDIREWQRVNTDIDTQFIRTDRGINLPLSFWYLPFKVTLSLFNKYRKEVK